MSFLSNSSNKMRKINFRFMINIFKINKCKISKLHLKTMITFFEDLSKGHHFHWACLLGILTVSFTGIFTMLEN